jgi:gamma-glutamylcyclotransferase (GGCT)/AIG2-like uncharacterized protein YtfP
MQKLFSYGSLQNTDIQMRLFGRELIGYSDVLHDYEMTAINIDGEGYSAAEPKADEKISGTVYELSSAELERADEYEGKSYYRIKVKLQSGTESWVYLRS